MRRFQPYLWVSVLLAVGSCGDDAPPPRDTVKSEDGGPAAADDGAIAEPEEQGDGYDTCLSGKCGPVRLPPQPEVPFLGDAGDGWLRLIEADWELAPNSEGWRCIRKTVPEDVYIASFSPVLPPGTHHTVLVLNEPSEAEPDGVTVCQTISGGARRLQGSGAGTEATAGMPDGVAMKIKAGEQLLMNLHLFNPSDNALRGTSGMRVKVTPKDQVRIEAEVRLAASLNLAIPRGKHVHAGTCTLTQPVTLFSVGPHMHQLGVHSKVVAHSSIVGEKVLHDAEFDFNHQLVYAVGEVPLAAGDRVTFECTHVNTTDRQVNYGESSRAEMCSVNLSVFPAMNLGGLCIY